MPPQPTPAPQLPLATNRAALSNQISLLLSRRTALLGSLTAGSLPPGGGGGRVVVVPDEDLKATRPNDGVGYVPGGGAGGGAVDSKPRDDLLRGRILGKRKGKGAAAPVRAEGESESDDDDEGRTLVGRAKKARVGETSSRDGEMGGMGEPRNKKKKKKKKGVISQGAG